MQLSLLLAIVAAIAVSENAPAHPVSFAGVRLTLAVLGIATVLIFAAASSFTVSRALRDLQADQDQRWWLLWFARLKRVHQALWLAIGGGILYALDWPQLVRYNWGLDGFSLIEDLLILAPVWMPLLLSWAAFYEVERVLQGTARCNSSPPPVRRASYVWLQARTHLGLCVLPVLILLLFQDIVSLVDPAWEDGDQAWVIFLLPIAGLTLAFPQLLSTIWKTTPLPDGHLRERLTRLVGKLGVRCRDFRVWHTDGQVMNAAVAGILPNTRYVFLTDALLEYLDEEEIAAVVVHELGHVQRRHLLLRLLLLAMPIWILGCLRVFHPHVEQYLDQVVARSRRNDNGHPVFLAARVGNCLCRVGARQVFSSAGTRCRLVRPSSRSRTGVHRSPVETGGTKRHFHETLDVAAPELRSTHPVAARCDLTPGTCLAISPSCSPD